jgi:hypothetical protein
MAGAKCLRLNLRGAKRVAKSFGSLKLCGCSLGMGCARLKFVSEAGGHLEEVESDEWQVASEGQFFTRAALPASQTFAIEIEDQKGQQKGCSFCWAVLICNLEVA